MDSLSALSCLSECLSHWLSCIVLFVFSLSDERSNETFTLYRFLCSFELFFAVGKIC